LVKLFSPEHGISAQGEDGAFQKNSTDPVTRLPVISLYGDRLSPTPEALDGIDAVLFDIPDIGCRFYTYLWTMTYMMQSCVENDKRIFVLDRPNPIGGDLDLVEGPLLDEDVCSSFVGRWSIPIRHSCTLGELARYFKATRLKNCDLEIIQIQHWKRDQPAKKADWLFIPPSPAIRDAETALIYPGMGLLEGINVNEGRGTEFPFKTFGAPWINASLMHDAFQNLQLPGIRAEVCSYKPESGLFAHQWCFGLQLTITSEAEFRPVNTGLQLIELIAGLYSDLCKERSYKTTANPSGDKHLDKLTGVAGAFEKIKNKQTPDPSKFTLTWKKSIQPYLLY